MKHIAALFIPAAVALGSFPSGVAHADDADTKVNIDQLPKPTRDTIEKKAQGGQLEEVDKLSDDGHLFKAEIKKGDAKEYLYVDSTGKVVGQHMKK
jgi:hypothetical protein